MSDNWYANTLHSCNSMHVIYSQLTSCRQRQNGRAGRRLKTFGMPHKRLRWGATAISKCGVIAIEISLASKISLATGIIKNKAKQHQKKLVIGSCREKISKIRERTSINIEDVAFRSCIRSQNIDQTNLVS